MFKIPTEQLVKLNNVVGRPSSILFCISGLESNCDAFRDLAECLKDKNVQLFGLQFTMEVPSEHLNKTVEFYIKKISDTIIELDGMLADGYTVGLCGYSIGGLLAIEICRQLEVSQTRRLKISNLILFETSHTFFKVGVLHNSKKFGKIIPNTSIFADNTVYTATLSIYLSAMIGIFDDQVKFELYNHLKSKHCVSLDDAIEKAFEYVSTKKYCEINDQETSEMKKYLKLMLIRSNAVYCHNYDVTYKLKAQVSLIKTKRFMYKKHLNDLYYLDLKANQPCKITMNEENYDLDEICNQRPNMLVCEMGNHWTFISENAQAISEFLVGVLFRESKELKSKL
jgi:hypothetical protein